MMNGSALWNAAVIVAAGSGVRMGGPVPKQFLKIGERPVLSYTLDVFERSDVIDEIIIVTGEDWLDYCKDEIAGRFGYQKVTAVTKGGAARCFSVRGGLGLCSPQTDYVFIHDGVRPMITGEIIKRGLADVIRFGSAVTSVASTDTVRIVDEEGNVVLTPERNKVRCMQTPQIFSFPDLKRAYEKMTEEELDSFTDDAMVWERYAGRPLHLFEGSLENIKITTPEDLIAAEKLLGK